MAPSPVRNDEVNLLSLIRERVKTRKFKGRMTRKCGGISDIQDSDQHQLSTRRTTVLHQQDVVAPLCPAGGSDLISREGTRYAELLGLITSDHATLQRRSTDQRVRTIRRADHMWSLCLDLRNRSRSSKSVEDRSTCAASVENHADLSAAVAAITTTDADKSVSVRRGGRRGSCRGCRGTPRW